MTLSTTTPPPDAVEPGPADYERMLELADLLTPQAIRVAVTLGIPRLVDAGTGALDDLAARTGAHPDALRSIVGALAARGFVRSTSPGHVELTTLGRTLLHPHAARAFDLTSAEAQIDRAFAALVDTVRTGEASYATVHGRSFWDHLASDPELAASFDSYLADHAIWAPDVAALPVWDDVAHVVDVGGGDGAALVAILGAQPHLRGTLVELAGPVSRAATRVDAAGLASRTTLVEGSFFDALPADGDVYLLAHVLHDWPDEEAAAILGRVAEANPSKVLVVDQIIDEDRTTFAQAFSDLRMRVLFASGERTESQWRGLASAAGLPIAAVHPWTFGTVLELRGLPAASHDA